MTDQKPSDVEPDLFEEVADKSEAAGIADESAAYAKATEPADKDAEQASEAHPS